MKCTDKFSQKYSNNSEMEGIIQNTDKVMSPYFMDDKNILDREILYETIYGFKQAIADKHGFSMDTVYRNISHLEGIIKKDEGTFDIKDDKSIGHFNPAGNNLSNNKQYFSTIEVADEKHISDGRYQETLTRQFVHLFAQEYVENGNGEVEKVGKSGLATEFLYKNINEAVAQKVTLDILKSTNNEVRSNDIYRYLENHHAELVHTCTQGFGYDNIVQSGAVLDKVFEKTIYGDMFNHTGHFASESQHYYNGEHKFPLNNLDSALQRVVENDTAENYLKAYKELSNVIFHKVDKEDLNVADYLKIMNTINDGHTFENRHYQHGCFLGMGDNGYIKAMDALCTSREIEHFYGEFNKKFNPETDLEKEINPFTRSKDCTNFLIVMQSLKDSNLEISMDKLQDLTWKDISRNGNDISIKYNYDDVDYFISAKKDLTTGLPVIQQDMELSKVTDFEKPSFFEKLRHKEADLTSEANFPYLAKLATISDFSDTIIKYSDSPETIAIHSACALNRNVFAENIDDIKLKNIKDSDDNNLFHILAQNERTYDTDIIISKMIISDKSEANKLLNQQNNEGKTPIDIAIENKNFAFIDECCGFKLDIKNADKYRPNIIEMKPLIHHLQENGHYDAVEGLLKGGHNPNMIDMQRSSLLHLIVQTDDYRFDNKKDVINALIQHSANPNIENLQGVTPLMAVCKSENPSVQNMQYLCDGLGADINCQNERGRTAVHYLLDSSVNNGSSSHNQILNELIKNGADINSPCQSFTTSGPGYDKKGELISPIQIATGADYTHTEGKTLNIDYNNITTLIQHGANINESHGNIPSALEMAHLTNDVNMFKSFIDGGMSVDKLGIENTSLSMSSQLELIKHSAEKEQERATEVEQESKVETKVRDMSEVMSM